MLGYNWVYIYYVINVGPEDKEFASLEKAVKANKSESVETRTSNETALVRTFFD